MYNWFLGGNLMDKELVWRSDHTLNLNFGNFGFIYLLAIPGENSPLELNFYMAF